MNRLVDRVGSRLAFFPPEPPSYQIGQHGDGAREEYVQPSRRCAEMTISGAYLRMSRPLFPFLGELLYDLRYYKLTARARIAGIGGGELVLCKGFYPSVFAGAAQRSLAPPLLQAAFSVLGQQDQLASTILVSCCFQLLLWRLHKHSAWAPNEQLWAQSAGAQCRAFLLKGMPVSRGPPRGSAVASTSWLSGVLHGMALAVAG
jgi:hypothetical protein